MRGLATRSGRALGLSLLLSPFGCSDGNVAGSVEVATWWGTPGELHGSFAVLEQSLRHSSGLDVQLAHHYQDKARHMAWIDQQLDPATVQPAPVDVFSANNGGDVLRWTPCSSSKYRPATARLLEVDDVALPGHLDSAWIHATFEPDVLDTLTCGGHVYALPVGIHQVNTIFYNKFLMQQAGYSVDGSPGAPFPSSLAELETAAARLQSLQTDLHPGSMSDSLPPSVFAVGGRDTWTLSEFFIENVMLAMAADAATYQDYWQGAHCDSGLLRDALGEIAKLRSYFGSWALDWTEARDRVIDGTAALMVMGDWMAADVDPNVVGHAPFPGTNGYFVFTADVFSIPDITTDPRKGFAWLYAITTRSTQAAFAKAKDALSARADLEGAAAPGSESAPTWVRSLPALLPGKGVGAPVDDTEPFEQLETKLGAWLDSQDDESIMAYAQTECEWIAGLLPTRPGVEVPPPR